jgi:translocation and assembly module TamB
VATTGELAYKAELGQIIRWTRDPRQSNTWNVTGQASGAGRVALGAGVSSAQLATTVDNLQVAAAARAQDAAGRPAQNVSLSQPAAWREQQMKLALGVEYDHAHDLLTISQAEITASALRMAMVGSIAALNTQRNFDLKGEVEYDWGQLAPLLQPYVGSRVTIAGHETRPFNLQGSWPVGEASPETQWQQLTGGGGIGWTNASVYGLGIGPGQLAGVLSRGIVQFQPLDLAVSGGMVHINEQWRILPAPGELRMAKGRLVEHVQVTPEVCKQALQYVAPILASVTRAEGTFSVDIEGGKLTFGSAAGCDVVGHLLTDQAHVQAGPLAQQFALLARRIEQLLLAQSATPDQATAVLVNLNDENVDFRAVAGRVYHRNLRFKIGALQITTQGSVGFDDSLEMLAEVAIEESLLANRPLLKQLLGHPLQIPLTGSLGAPQLDLRGVEDITRHMARDAATSVITKPIEAIEKPLENLFAPKQGP